MHGASIDGSCRRRSGAWTNTWTDRRRWSSLMPAGAAGQIEIVSGGHPVAVLTKDQPFSLRVHVPHTPGTPVPEFMWVTFTTAHGSKSVKLQSGLPDPTTGEVTFTSNTLNLSHGGEGSDTLS